MKITLVQTDIAWEDKKANLIKYESLLDDLGGQTDIVVLPEMFNTGFSMNSRSLAETMSGDTVKWMEEMVNRGGFALMGSLIVSEGSKYFNRLVFMKPGGNYCTYDKGHLFRMEKENDFFTKGRHRLTERYREWNFSLQVCYDLRFPVWSRNVDNAYDILVYVANWPASRRNVWNTLLRARAIENQCFVAGVNRIGKDGNGLGYCGDTALIDPKGEVVGQTKLNAEDVLTTEISMENLKSFRSRFPVWLDADPFELVSDH